MNLEWIIEEATSVESILQNTTLFNAIVLIMSSVDHKQPAGACCGKGKVVAELFLNNKDKYISAYEKVTNRTIVPKWKGLVYFSSAREMINADILTDDDILELIRSKKMNESMFDFSNYTQKNEENKANNNSLVENAEKSQPATQVNTDSKKNSKNKKKRK